MTGKSIHAESTSVGVIDNLLCVFSKEDKVTLLLDVADVFSDDKRVFREGISVSDSGENEGCGVSIHDER